MPPFSRPPLLPPSPPSSSKMFLSSPRPPRMDRKTSRSQSRTSPRSSRKSLETLAMLEQLLHDSIHKHGSTHPGTAHLFNQLGNVYFRLGKLRQSKECYQNAVCCDPGTHTATAYLNLGTVYWSCGDIPQSIQVLDQALACHELDMVAEGTPALDRSLLAASVHHQLGLCHALKGEFPVALACLQRAFEIRERAGAAIDAAKTTAATAKVLFLKGDWKQAVERYETAYKALSTHHALTTVHLEGMAQAYEAVEDFGNASKMYREMLGIPGLEPVREALAIQKIKAFEEKDASPVSS